MSIVQTLKVTGTAKQVIPVPGSAHAEAYHYVLQNSGSVTIRLLDSPTQTVAEGFPLLAGASIPLNVKGDEVFAATASGESELELIGTISSSD